VVLTPQGIIAGADGKGMKINYQSPTMQSAAGGVVRKILLMQNRMVLASSGLENAGTGTTAIYDFVAWSKSIDHSLPANTSVTRLSEIIERNVAETFDGFDILLKTGRFTREQAPRPGDTLVNYLVAGYESGAPLILPSESRHRLGQSSPEATS
jgi:hypothetical protein